MIPDILCGCDESKLLACYVSALPRRVTVDVQNVTWFRRLTHETYDMLSKVSIPTIAGSYSLEMDALTWADPTSVGCIYLGTFPVYGMLRSVVTGDELIIEQMRIAVTFSMVDYEYEVGGESKTGIRCDKSFHIELIYTGYQIFGIWAHANLLYFEDEDGNPFQPLTLSGESVLRCDSSTYVTADSTYKYTSPYTRFGPASPLTFNNTGYKTTLWAWQSHPRCAYLNAATTDSFVGTPANQTVADCTANVYWG